MKKGDFVIITTFSSGRVGIYPFGKDRSWADDCYDVFDGDTVTLYVVDELFIDDLYLRPIKTRKEEE